MMPEYIAYDQRPETNDKRFQFLLMDLIDLEQFWWVKQERMRDGRFPFVHVELFEHLRKDTPCLKIDFEKENVYSLGLIVLYIAMPFNYKGMYFDNLRLDEESTSN